MSAATGSCLCKAVSFQFPIKEKIFDACHCGMCRKWTGGPAMMVDASLGIKFQGEEFVSVYESSEWAERGFCKKCGTHLFYRLKEGNFLNVPFGTIDNSDDFEFKVQIFIDKKPNNYNFAEKTEQLTEAQVFAMFAPKE